MHRNETLTGAGRDRPVLIFRATLTNTYGNGYIDDVVRYVPRAHIGTFDPFQRQTTQQSVPHESEIMHE